jgi:hypothetical protein
VGQGQHRGLGFGGAPAGPDGRLWRPGRRESGCDRPRLRKARGPGDRTPVGEGRGQAGSPLEHRFEVKRGAPLGSRSRCVPPSYLAIAGVPLAHVHRTHTIDGMISICIAVPTVAYDAFYSAQAQGRIALSSVLGPKRLIPDPTIPDPTTCVRKRSGVCSRSMR